MKDKTDLTQPINGEISLKEIIVGARRWYGFILSKWKTIFIFAIIGSLSGCLYSYFKKTVYTATTTFVLEEGEKSGGLGQYAGIASMVGVDLGGGGGGIFQGDNILELYKSRTMIEKTLLTEVVYNGRKDLLVNLYIDFNHLREKWVKEPGLNKIQFDFANEKALPAVKSRLQDSILGVIAKDINKSYLIVTKPDKKLSIIDVLVSSKNEFFAKVFNDEIVKNVNDFYIQTKTKKSLANVLIIQKKTDSVRAVMNGAIYSGAAILDATPNLNVTRQVQRVAPVQRSQFNVETNKAVLGELIKNLELSKISLLKETPLIQVVDKPIFPLEETKISMIKGVFFGTIIFGFLSVFILSFKMLLNDVNEE